MRDSSVNPYKFDRRRMNEILTCNPDWTINQICKEANVSQEVIDAMNVNERTRLKKLKQIKAATLFNHLCDVSLISSKLTR